MPNWCENSLEVNGPKEEVKKFVEFVKGTDTEWEGDGEEQVLSFQKILPVPKAVVKKGFDKTGYNWCSKNWGTKWSASDVEFTKNTPNNVVYEFMTAWSPPTPVVKALAKKFPKLTLILKYDEPGVGFRGHLTMEKGKVAHDVCKNIY